MLFPHAGEDLLEEEVAELMLVTRQIEPVLRATLNPDGFNIGMNLGRAAGAGAQQAGDEQERERASLHHGDPPRLDVGTSVEPSRSSAIARTRVANGPRG